MKEWNDKYNPFNSSKIVYNAYLWEQMKDGIIPPPVLLTLDPINKCNYNCSYCNAAYKMKHSSSMYSDYVIDNIASFLSTWGVKAVCLAGGGEPMLHPRFSDLIQSLNSFGIEVGVVTNGSLIHKHIDVLDFCRWVGVSVDAGTSDVYSNLKKVPKKAFNKVISNIKKLRKSHPYLEITYKFLAHPDNIGSVYDAVKIAKKAGCNFFHLRPVGKTWDNLDAPDFFTPLDVAIACAHLDQARDDFEDSGFKIFGITHKFGANWGIKRSFNKCYAIGMTCVINPDNVVGLCCDRRGDSSVDLCKFEALEEIKEHWSSEKHWEILHSIDLKDCPRCTYSPHNEIYEHFITFDSTCKYFI